MNLIEARNALLDVLEMLGTHRKSVVLVGAQAVYIHTEGFFSPVAEYTKDADLAFNPDSMESAPLIELVLDEAGYSPNENGQPGSWVSPTRVPVDFMVPEKLSKSKGRSAGIHPHAKHTARKTPGIEGCLVDSSLRQISSFAKGDSRSYEISVAGPASLIIAKSYKIYERLGNPSRIQEKDAHDIYRMLSAVSIETLIDGFNQLLANPLSEGTTRLGLDYFEQLFALGSEAVGAKLAGQTEFGIGQPETVAQSTRFLSQDLLKALGRGLAI